MNSISAPLPAALGSYDSASAEKAARYTDIRSVVLLALRDSDLARYATATCQLLTAATTADAVAALSTRFPKVVAVDWDDAEIDALAICKAAKNSPFPALLLTITDDRTKAPVAIKQGCHAILLKPFAPNLFAARLGRMLRHAPNGNGNSLTGTDGGSNKAWPAVKCVTCGAGGAVSFDFSSYRRAWYACLSCDSTWLAKLPE